MSKNKIFVSGLMNIETTVKIRSFPINYYPIDYPFFGVNSAVSGVGINVGKALKKLDNYVCFTSLIGNDFEGEKVLKFLDKEKIDCRFVKRTLKQTPASVILYDDTGKRQIYCDLKDIQDTEYPIDEQELKNCMSECSIAVICNTNYNRKLLKFARNLGMPIATDVHVLSDINDGYNKEFMENADILFLSDEQINEDHEKFILKLKDKYINIDIIVLGRGSKGAMMYVRKENAITTVPAVNSGKIVNTVGAGDALFSGFINYFSKGYTPIESLDRAQIFASFKIGFNGASEGFINEEKVENIYSRRKNQIDLKSIQIKNNLNDKI